jgi:hypothetical protein
MCHGRDTAISVFVLKNCEGHSVNSVACPQAVAACRCHPRRASMSHAPMARAGGMREQKITLNPALPGCWSIARTIAAPIRSQSTPVSGRTMSGCPISSRSSPVGLAVTVAPTSDRILMARAWVQERDNKKGLAAQIRRSDPTVRRPVARYAPRRGNLHHCAAENGVGSSGMASRYRGADAVG